MKMLKVNNLSVKLGEFTLRDVSFGVDGGEYFMLLGRSGAGKSVLLQLVSGLIQADSGEILMNGKDISRERIQKRRVGLVFQDSALFPHLKVSGNIAYPLRAMGEPGRRIEHRVAELAGMTSVTHLLDRYPENLSGGEKQRVALARALALEPDCLLLDEPLSSLDVQLRGGLRSLLREINGRGQTIVHVTHDHEEAAMLGRHIAVLEKGTVVQTGTPSEVFQHPRSEFVANFTGIRNFFSGVLGGGSSLRRFETGGTAFMLLSDAPSGEGFVVIRAEDVFISNEMSSSSAVNNLKGRVVSIGRAGNGSEVIVDVGVHLAALLSDESVSRLGITPGKAVWAGFKASALRYTAK